MRKIAGFAVLLLTGCQAGPTYVVFKPGVSLDQTSAAIDQCRIQSLREIPQALATDVSGGVYSPGSLQCTTYGNSTSCNRVGAIDIPASSSTYDVNQDLRDRYVKRCVEAKGFSITPSRACLGDSEKRKAIADRKAGIRPSCAVPIG